MSTTAATETLPTKNEEWGFYGTIKGSPKQRDRAFASACRHYMTVYGLDAIDARNLLDSRFGRHLADALTNPNTDLAWIDTNWGRWVRKSIAEAKANRDRF